MTDLYLDLLGALVLVLVTLALLCCCLALAAMASEFWCALVGCRYAEWTMGKDEGED